MGMYTGLRFKGTVKEQFRREFEPIALSGCWESSTDGTIKTFANVSRASFIPCGSLCYMPDSWDETDKIENFYDVITGCWTFQCSLKNYEDTIELFLGLVPYFIESVDYCEVFYEEWTYSKRYELINNTMEVTDSKFIEYGFYGDSCVDELSKTETAPEPPLKFFRYYWYNSCRCERTVGLVRAKYIEEARTILQKVYKYVNIAEWQIEEIEFSQNGHCEVYYGG